MTIPVDMTPHGAMNGYTNHRCRCDKCRKAIADYHRIRYKKPCARGCGGLAWHGPERTREGVCAECRAFESRTADHGTESRYKRGCRCAECRTAASANRARRRSRARTGA